MNIKKISNLIWKKIPNSIKFIFIKEYIFPANILERIEGLDYLFNKSKNSTILDIGSEQGLISYEFGKHGAKTIHGFEINKIGVKTANIIFSRLPTNGKFFQWDLTNKIEKYDKKFKQQLLNKYDIVLYLGIYNHLRTYMKRKDLLGQIQYFLNKTNKYFIVRDDYIYEFEKLIFKNNFTKVYSLKKSKKNLNIYKKNA